MTTELPVSRTGATDREVEAHEHRWSPWRSVGVAFAYDGTEVGTGIVEVNGNPVTPGWSRRCACVDVETNVAHPAATPDSGQRDRLARWLFERDYREQCLCSPMDAPWGEWVERNQDEWREEADAVLALLAEQPGGGM